VNLAWSFLEQSVKSKARTRVDETKTGLAIN
jgi:hypothetical protein